MVEGFPNIMPNVSKPPIGLNRSELWATAAFLQSLGGTVDVKLDDVPQVATAAAGAAASLELPGNPKAGQAVFTGKGACVACHKAGAVGASPVGPDLSNIAGSQTPEYIMGKILDPGLQGHGVRVPARASCRRPSASSSPRRSTWTWWRSC